MRGELQLTDQDQAALNGDLGPLQSFAMSLIVQAANAWGAQQLTDVTFAHIDACHFNGQTHLDFARLLQKHGAKFAVPTWTNTLPISLLESDSRSQADPDFLSGAREVANIYKELGCSAVYTCAPYQLPGGPVAGQHIVGSESNAVSYYNSVVGARTQKYGDFLDVSCALLGRAPLAGLHRDQGRKANLLLDVSALPQDAFDQEITYHLLGHIMGSTAGDRLPALQGMNSRPTDDQYKAIAAAGAASGGVAMFHVIGHTPEAASIDQACDAQVDCVKVTTADLESARAELSTFDHGTIDMVALGTPHFSVDEFRRLAAVLDGKQVAPSVRLYVSTSRFVFDIASELGAVDVIERAGGIVLQDTCTYFTPAVRGCAGRVVTNSAKWAFYAPGMLPVDVALASLESCARSAVRGEFCP